MFKIYECLTKFSTLYKINQINRFSTEYHLHEESVSSHSYYVSLFIYYLHNFYNFDLLKSLKMSLIHDLPENYIGDFPYHIKSENFKLFEIFDDLDKKYINNCSEIFNEINELCDEFNNHKSVESIICNFADKLSSALFCYTEVNLGNNLFKNKLESKLEICKTYLILLKNYIKEV